MRHGTVIQINRSNGGMPKGPVGGPVMLDATGVAGDRQRNLRVHGGPNKAVLIIASEAVDELIAQSFPLFYGALGENLTVSGLDRSLWRGGQQYRIGESALIELTKPRSPCANLDVYGPGIQAALCGARGGYYARVLKPGVIVAGAPVILEAELA